MTAGEPKRTDHTHLADPGTARGRLGRPLLLAGVAVALLLVVGVGWMSKRSIDRPDHGASAGNTTTAGVEGRRTDDSAAAAQRHEAPIARRRPLDGADTSPDLADHIPAGREPTMGEVISELHRRGISTGIGAFNPPGTSPPLLGIAVPEDYVLPEGYVRHHQVTDDGQPIEPILMYSPDYEFYDSQGRRIDVPADRVVPPHLIPPGLPPRTITVPPPRDPRGSP